MDRTYDILLLDDDAVDRLTVRRQLKASNLLHQLTEVGSVSELRGLTQQMSYQASHGPRKCAGMLASSHSTS